MDKEKVIELLNYDISNEIEAILTYLRHSFVLDEYCEISREAEEIAVEEMRHMEWLSEWVVKLGGTPTVEHIELKFPEKTAAEMMKHNIELEVQAIADYEKHIDMVDDPKLKRLLGRIKFEEEDHLEEFKELAEEAPDNEQENESADEAETEKDDGLTVGSLKK